MAPSLFSGNWLLKPLAKNKRQGLGGKPMTNKA